MDKAHTIEATDGKLTIYLHPRQPLAIKFGLTVYAVVYVCMGLMLLGLLGLMMLGLMRGTDMFRSTEFSWIIGVIALLIFTGVYLLLARSFIRRLTHKEIIEVNADKIAVTDLYIWSRKVRGIDLKYVRYIGVADAEKFTPHPMEDNNAAINFGINERLIRYQISDGNMEIISGKNSIRFGKDLPSWDIEEIVHAIEQYAGRSFTQRTAREPLAEGM